jgi:hypothetical protein
MSTEMDGWIRRNWEPIVIIGGAILVTLAISQFPNFLAIYQSNLLDSLILQFGGVLLGLLLAAYAIFLGLIPIVEKDVLNAPSFNTINTYFKSVVFLTIVAIILSFLILFLSGIAQEILILLQLISFFAVVFWGIELAIVLSNLFIYVKNLRLSQ